MSDHYDAKTGEFTGVERRKQDIVQQVQKVAEALALEVRQVVKDQEALGEIHRQHIDGMINQIMDSQKQMFRQNEASHLQIVEANKALIDRVEKLIDTNVSRFNEALDRHDEKIVALDSKVELYQGQNHSSIRTTNDRINDLETRLNTMEQSDIKDDATKWREFWATVRNILIGAILTGALTMGGFLIWGWQEQWHKMQATVPKSEAKE